MKHVISYTGKTHIALGLMREEYVPLFVRAANWRIEIEGTLQRPPYSFAQGAEWVRKLDGEKGRHEVFAILQRIEGRKKEYRYIGHTGIHGIEWPAGVATTGSMIVAGTHQCRGHGTEAKLLLLYHAFMVLGLRKLTSNVKEFNIPSAAHLMKCGYKPVGRYCRHHLHNGRFVDSLLFEVFREDWESVWGAYQATGELPHLTDEQRSWLRQEMHV